MRDALSYVSDKDCRAVSADLKSISSAATVTDAEAALIEVYSYADAVEGL